MFIDSRASDNAELRNKKKERFLSVLKNRFVCSALSVTRQIAKISKTGVAGMAHDNVVEHFDL